MKDRDRSQRLAVVLLAGLVAFGAVSCSSDDSPNGSAKPTTTTTATTVSTGAPSSNGAVKSGPWEKVIAPFSCRCSDNSEYHFWVRRGDPKKVLFYLEGGGACFSAETCASKGATYTVNLAKDDGVGASGIFDFENKANPLRDYSMVVAPYCTGDLHLGTSVHDYGNGVVVHHNGFINGSTAMAAAAALFPQPDEVVVAGASAGSAGAPAYGGAAHDVFPDAKVSVIADSSAAYPGSPEITLAIGGLWGTKGSIPPWPETEDLPPEAWSLPGLFVNASKHDPALRFATYNTAYDKVQSEFSAKIGTDPANLVDLIDENNTWIRDRGVTIQNWVAPGNDHTVLQSDDLYTEEVKGTKLIDWLSNFIVGEKGPDIHCEDCKKPK